MRDPFTAFTNTNGVVFPDTEAVNASGPSETDGTEFVKIGIDDGMDWGAAQALLDAAGLTPNGSAEAVGNSQKLDAMEILFGIPDKYISGLVPSSAADAAHDITFGVGEARSGLAASLVRILLATAITKQIDANWVAGNDVGGFPSGLTLTDAVWYHLFVIKNNTTGVVDAGFDSSLTAVNLLADATGYTEFRRIGSVLHGAVTTSVIDPFFASETGGGGVEFLWDAAPTDEDDTAPGTAAVLVTLSTPLGLETDAKIHYFLSDGGNAAVLVTSVEQSDIAPDGSNFTLDVSAASTIAHVEIGRKTDTSSQIRYRTDVGTGLSANRIFTLGWNDSRRQ